MSSSQKAIDFLTALYPEGPWCLSAINPLKGKGIETRTFTPATVEECRAFFEKHNDRWNLYYHANPVMGLLKKKAELNDVKEVVLLQVDVDPSEPHGCQTPEEFAAFYSREQDKLVKMFLSKEHGGKPFIGIPLPTALIFTGGGFQALWKLKVPIPIDGDLAKAHAAGDHNRVLSAIYQGDHCHSIDHLLRLPGSWNIPGETKLAKGRVKVEAKVITLNLDRTYSLEDFPVLEESQLPPRERSKGRPKKPVALPEHITTLHGLDELDRWKVPERIKSMIEHGQSTDPEVVEAKTKRLGKAPSRSEWLWDVTCGLVRCDVPVPLIYGILMDEKWKISESVLELRHGAMRYAAKQITDAAETVIKEKQDAPVGSINIGVAEVHETAALIQDAFKAAGAELYRQGPRLVHIFDKADALAIHQCNDTFLALYAAKLGIRFHFVRDGRPISCDGSKAMKWCVENLKWSDFPVINGLVTTPTLERNEPGYDEATRLYLAFKPGRFDQLAMEPTKEQAEAAMERLEEPVAEYPFKSDVDKAVWLAGMLLAPIRGQMGKCPVFAFDAPKRGSGKSKLAEMIGLLSIGRRPPPIPFSNDKEETKKALIAALAGGSPFLFYDNINTVFEHPRLDAAITSTSIKDRVLGFSKDVELSTRVMVTVTGNHLLIGGDMQRRVLRCQIVPSEQYAEDREFDFDPVKMVEDNRDQFVMDALTVMRAYKTAGWPGMKTLPAYDLDGLNMVRGALVWLGHEDPVDCLKGIRAESMDSVLIREIVEVVAVQFDQQEKFLARDLVDHPYFRPLIRDSKVPSMSVGQLLKKACVSPINGVTLHSKIDGQGYTKWWWDGEATGELAETIKSERMEVPF